MEEIVNDSFRIDQTIYSGDLNDIKTTGIYNQLIGWNATNGVNDYAYLLVFAWGTSLNFTQVAIGYRNPFVKTRVHFMGEWSEWI